MGVAEPMRISGGSIEKRDDPGDAGIEPQTEAHDDDQSEESFLVHQGPVEPHRRSRDGHVFLQEPRHHEEEGHPCPAGLLHAVEHEEEARRR